MSSSPFHGIFNAFGYGDAHRTGEDAPPWNHPDCDGAVVSANSLHPVSKKEKGQMSVDVYEQEQYIIIRAPVAGVRLADLDIEVHGNTVTIRGNRAPMEDASDGRYYVRECFWGPFQRRITLPHLIDPKKVKATFNREGILKIIIPKEDRVKIVQIDEQ